MKNILENIKAIRMQKGYSQEYVAIELGLKSSGYNLVENGKRNLQYSMLLQIANILSVPVINIITYPDEYQLKADKLAPVEATVQIKLYGNKKDQVLKIVLGDDYETTLNK